MRAAYITHDSLESTAIIDADTTVTGRLYNGIDKWTGRPIVVRAQHADEDVPFVEEVPDA